MICAICKVNGAALECVLCRTPHHEECWRYNFGKCSVYGCRSCHHSGQMKDFQDVYRLGQRIADGGLETQHVALGTGWLLTMCALVFCLPFLILAPYSRPVFESVEETVEIEDRVENNTPQNIRLDIQDAIIRLNTPLGLPIRVCPSYMMFFDGEQLRVVPFNGGLYQAKVLSDSLPTESDVARQSGTCR